MSISESAAPVCEEKARLLRLCTMAESHHQIVVQQVIRLIGRPEKPNYEDLTELAETARRIRDDAHEALERHTAEHGC
jgi:glutathione S-transferase